jgi:hypothetical protein
MMDRSVALRGFRYVYVAYIVYASAKTLVFALGAMHGLPLMFHLPVFLMGLASLEIAAALLFLAERHEVTACAALLAIYAVASAITVAQGEVPAHLVFYAATALFIVVSRRGTVSAQLARP